MDAVLRFVEAGLGVAVVPSMVLAGRPGLGALRWPARPAAYDRAGPPQGRPPTHAARAFHETLLGFLADSEAHGELPPGVERVSE